MYNILSLVFLSIVHISASEVCYYDDIDGHSLSTVCPGECCGTGSQPCCLDSGAIIAIFVGVVVTIFLLVFCAVVCYVERRHSRRFLLNRERRIFQRLERANIENYRNLSISGEIDLPPRYSDLFPRENNSFRSPENARISGTGSEGRRSLSSLGSLLRLSFGINRTNSLARRANNELNVSPEQSVNHEGNLENLENRDVLTENENTTTNNLVTDQESLPTKNIGGESTKSTTEVLPTLFENENSNL